MAIALPYLPERPPTSNEIRTWERLKQSVEIYNNRVIATRLRFENIGIVYRFGFPRGFALPLIADEDKARLEALETNADKLIRIARAVDDKILGIQLRPDGDIDILAPPDVPRESLQQYQLVSVDDSLGWIIPIAIGMLALAGVFAIVAHLSQENDKLTSQFNRVLESSNQIICADPNSKNCIDWKQTRQNEGYDRRETVAESLGKAIKVVGKGAGIGLAVAIGIAAISFFGGLDE